MITLVAVPLICWLCALLAIPRRPVPGNEMAELVHRRLVARQQQLVALAASVTLVACCCACCSLFARAASP